MRFSFLKARLLNHHKRFCSKPTALRTVHTSRMLRISMSVTYLLPIQRVPFSQKWVELAWTVYSRLRVCSQNLACLVFSLVDMVHVLPTYGSSALALFWLLLTISSCQPFQNAEDTPGFLTIVAQIDWFAALSQNPARLHKWGCETSQYTIKFRTDI
jgi:hypothetical protein